MSLPRFSLLQAEKTSDPNSAEHRLHEKQRRRKELLIAIFAFILVLILTTIQLEQFRTGDRLFVAMFNVNFVLLLVIAVVVIRNSIKLILERRRKVPGSKLRTKMVLAFLSLSILPCLLMFLVTAKYVQLSMDFWFKEQVETSMDTALDVARGSFEKVGGDLCSQSNYILSQIEQRKLPLESRAVEALLQQKQQEYNLALTGFFFDDGKMLYWNATHTSGMAWIAASKEINWDTVHSQGAAYVLVTGFTTDYIFSATKFPNIEGAYLVFANDMGAGFKAKIDRVINGNGEYKNLRNIKRPLKHLLYSSLGVLTALIILGALWFAFRIAKEISAPVLAVAAGTERIAKGDLSVRLKDTSEDELGLLVRSFNDMAQDLEKSRKEVTGINNKLERQNKKIARHSKYVETVLNSIAAGVISFSPEGRIVTLNKAAADILAVSSNALLHKKVEEILPEPYASNVLSIREKLSQRTEGRVSQTFSLPINGEERQLLLNVVGFSSDGVYSGAVAVFEDISELERIQRMAAWREVARRIAHEIKNPLTPIKLSAQRLAKKFYPQVNDPVFLQSTELIVTQVEHLQSMVQEFSAFAKLPEVKPLPGRIEPLLHDIIELFRNSHTSISWKIEIAKNIPSLPIDEEALNRAFMNLLSNAAEALLSSQQENPCVTVSAIYDSEINLIKIDVADNGPGLTEEERGRAFEPYFSKKKGGTGLGLTIVRSIVSDHRGYVRALPRTGGGTIISMELPLS